MVIPAVDKRGQLEGFAFSVNGANAILERMLGYDEFIGVATITYPTPSGAAPFVITQEHDPFGHVLRVLVTYTAFDLPKSIQQGALTLATFGYDGDQTRIRPRGLSRW